MMANVGRVATKRIPRFIIFFLLLTFSPILAEPNIQIFNFMCYRSRRCPLALTVEGRAARKLDALRPPAPGAPDEFAVARHPPAPSPSHPLPPSPSPNRRPAVFTPNAHQPHVPGSDLLPFRAPPSAHTPSISVAPITSPVASSKKSHVAVTLGATLGVLVFLTVAVSAAAYFKPDWLPCCKESRRSYYERHLPT